MSTALLSSYTIKPQQFFVRESDHSHTYGSQQTLKRFIDDVHVLLSRRLEELGAVEEDVDMDNVHHARYLLEMLIDARKDFDAIRTMR